MTKETEVTFRKLLIESVRKISSVKTLPSIDIDNRWFYIPEIKTLISPTLLNEFLQPKGTTQSFHVGIFSAGISELWQVVLAWILLESSKDMEVSVGCDVGVNAISTTREALDLVNRQDVIICTAGMEAILPEVLASHCDATIIAVPSDVSSGIDEGVVSFWSVSNISRAGIALFNINGIASACKCVNRIRALKSRGGSSLGDYNSNSLVSIEKGTKDQHQIEKFISAHCEKRHCAIKTSTKHPIHINQQQFTSHDLSQAQQLFILPFKSYKPMESTLRVAIIPGGFDDQQIANEIYQYFHILLVGDVQIIHPLSIPHVMKTPPVSLSNAHIVVAIAGSSGTFPNLISGMFPEKLIVAVPVSQQAMLSMVNGCVFGVPVMGTKNPALNAVTFVLSVLSPCNNGQAGTPPINKI